MEQMWMHAYNKDNQDQSAETPANAPAQTTPAPVKKPSRRGFASMDKAKQREIARKGGRAAHMKGTAHEFTSEEARQAGRKGGESVSRDRKHMAEIGRGGGQARSARLRAKREAEEAAKRAQAGQVQPASNPPQEGATPNVGATDPDYKKGNAY